jgi:hypothetical protein
MIRNMLALVGGWVIFLAIVGTFCGDFRLYYGPDFSKSGMCGKPTGSGE